MFIALSVNNDKSTHQPDELYFGVIMTTSYTNIGVDR